MSVVVALVAIAVTLGAAAAAVLAASRGRAWWALVALVPVATGLVVRAGGIDVDLPGRAWVVVLSGAVLLLGVVAGGPLSLWVLERAKPPRGTASAAAPEVLRGGATIGYLERLAVVAAAATGRFEIVAAVIAVKGLGRFRELDTPAAREKFIIGTLASLLWAGTCGALVFADRW